MRFKFHGLDSAGFDRWVATAKASGRTLDRAAYTALARPSENVPVMRFATVENGLYSAALNMCVAPGTPCMAETMRKDAHTARSEEHTSELQSLMRTSYAVLCLKKKKNNKSHKHKTCLT